MAHFQKILLDLFNGGLYTTRSSLLAYLFLLVLDLYLRNQSSSKFLLFPSLKRRTILK